MPKQKATRKKEGGHIENDKNGLNRCIAGRTWMEDCGGTGEHHLQQLKRSIENTEKYTENNKQHHENKITSSWEQKTKYKNTRKIKKENAKNLTYREENKEAMRQTQRERYKRDKNKINAKTKRKAKTEERRTTTNQPKAIHAYYIFYSFHLLCSIYYSSYHDQLISLCISCHSIDF